MCLSANFWSTPVVGLRFLQFPFSEALNGGKEGPPFVGLSRWLLGGSWLGLGRGRGYKKNVQIRWDMFISKMTNLPAGAGEGEDFCFRLVPDWVLVPLDWLRDFCLGACTDETPAERDRSQYTVHTPMCHTHYTV